MPRNIAKEAITEYVKNAVERLSQDQHSSKKDVLIHFLQMRSLPHCQLHEVMSENEEGHQRYWLCFLLLDEQDTWFVKAAADITESSPVRTYPWINLAGGGREDEFWVGGRIIDNGFNVERVRLIATNGSILEDRIQNDVALFVTDQKVRMPLQVELYNHSGRVVGTHTFPYSLSQPI
jgi:hypothetical protein